MLLLSLSRHYYSCHFFPSEPRRNLAILPNSELQALTTHQGTVRTGPCAISITRINALRQPHGALKAGMWWKPIQHRWYDTCPCAGSALPETPHSRDNFYEPFHPTQDALLSGKWMKEKGYSWWHHHCWSVLSPRSVSQVIHGLAEIFQGPPMPIPLGHNKLAGSEGSRLRLGP